MVFVQGRDNEPDRGLGVDASDGLRGFGGPVECWSGREGCYRKQGFGQSVI